MSGAGRYDKPCLYCGTMLDEYGCEDSDIPAAGIGPICHYASVCLERVHAALRATRRDVVALRAENVALREVRDAARNAVECIETRTHDGVYLGHRVACRDALRAAMSAADAATKEGK